MPEHVYLSPHLDDAAISCGGLIARQVAAGETVTVLTICAGDPPEGQLSDFARALQMLWQAGSSPISARREEDLAACKRLGAAAVHLEIPDAVYRPQKSSEPFYPTFDDIFGPLHPSESDLLEELTQSLDSRCPEDACIYAPLAIGGHVDHRLTRLAADRLHRRLFFYRDMPYAFRDGIIPPELPEPRGTEHVFRLTEIEIDAWHAAVLEYRSQISSFWESDLEVRKELQAYHDAYRGLKLVERA